MSRPALLLDPMTAPKSRPRGYAEKNASGKTARSAPEPRARPARSTALERVSVGWNPTGAACTTAAVKLLLTVCLLERASTTSDGPGPPDLSDRITVRRGVPEQIGTYHAHRTVARFQ